MIFLDKRELIESLINVNDVVLDIGFWGQGVTVDDPNWTHAILLRRSKELHGIDLDFDESRLPQEELRYSRQSAEDFSLQRHFDVLFAGDVLEHLSNPGLFLDAARRHLNSNGRLVVSTPNCFNLFNLFEKLVKPEPTVNYDHTCYFNRKTLATLLAKNGWKLQDTHFLYSLGCDYQESLAKKAQNAIYWLASSMTSKFVETLVVVATPEIVT